MEFGVARAKDLSHSACADRRNDFVDTETAAGRERQRSGLYERTAELKGQSERRGEARGECHFRVTSRRIWPHSASEHGTTPKSRAGANQWKRQYW